MAWGLTTRGLGGMIASMKTSILLVRIALAAAIWLQAEAALATTTRIWQGPSGGGWSVAGNWTNGVPAANDNVQFGSNAVSTCDMTVTIGAIVFTGTNARLQGDGSHVLTINGTLASDNITSAGDGNSVTLPITLTSAPCYIVSSLGTLTMSGVLSGSVGLQTFGPGTVLMNGAASNTYTGTTTVASGVLELGSSSAGSVVPGDLLIGGTAIGNPPGTATLRLTFRDCIANASNVTIASDGVLDLSGFTETVATLSGTGPVSLGTRGLLTVSSSSAFTYSGNITGGTTSGLIKSGPGSMTLAGTATVGCPGLWIFDGALVVQAGTNLSAVQRLTMGDGVGAAGSASLQLTGTQQVAAGCNVAVLADGSLNLGNFNQTFGLLQVLGGGLNIGTAAMTVSSLSMSDGSINASGGGSLQLQGDVIATSSSAGAMINSTVALNGDRLFHVTSGPVQPELTITGVVADGSASSGLRKDGSGTMDVLTTTNTYTGVTEVEAGVMRIKASGVTAIQGDVVIGNDFDPPGSAVLRDLTFGNDIAATSAVTVHSSGVFDISTGSVAEHIGSLAGKGQVNTGAFTLVVGANGLSTEFDGTLSGTGHLLVVNSPAVLSLGCGGLFSGSLVLGTTATPPPPAPPVVSPGNVLLRSSLLGSATASVTSNSRLVAATGYASTLNSVVVASGSALQVQAGSSLVTGTVSVSSGGVATVDGSLEGTSGISVVSGGILNGTGQVQNLSSVPSGATVSAGDGAIPGRLEMITSATFTSGSTIGIPLNEASGSINGQIQVDNLLTLGNATLAVTAVGPITRNAYIVASYQSLSGSLGSITGMPAGYSPNYSYVDGAPLPHIALVKAGLVTTSAATSVTGNAARLNGIVNPAGKATGYYFQYGPTSTYGSTTPVAGGLTGSANVAVGTTVSGLNGGTTYHYQLVATNSGGPISGADMTFTTPGPAAFTGIVTSISALSATLAGTVNPNGNATTAWFEYGPSPALGLKTAPVAAGSGFSAVIESAAVTGLKPATTYYFRMAGSNATGTTRGQIFNIVTKVVLPPVIIPGGLPPAGVFGGIGGPVTLGVAAMEGSPSPTDAPLSYQWSKNGAAIAGATSSSYTIFVSSLSVAGAYACTIRNIAGSLTTPPTQLAAVDVNNKVANAPVGGSVTLTPAAAGNVLGYQWFKGSTLLPNAVSRTLTLSHLSATDDGPYVCAVTNEGATMELGSIILSVYSGAPHILTPVTLPDGIVGGSYSFTIPVDPGPNVAPTGFTATGLPPGLAVNSLGVISGRISGALAADHAYTVTMHASNSKGSSAAATAALHVHPFPSGVTGTYNGLVNRDALPLPAVPLNNGLGGTLNLVLATNGAFTGRLVLGGGSWPFSGVSFATAGNPDINATATIVRAGLHTLTLTVASDVTTGKIQGTLTDPIGGASVNYVSYHNPWKAAGNPYDRPGVFNTELTIDPGVVGNLAYPQGIGYAVVTVTTAGTVTWAGKLADGSAPTTTFSTTISQDDMIPVQLLVDAGTGSAHGTVTVTADNPSPVNNGQPLIGGTLDWVKHAQATSTDRVYNTGFLLFNLNAKGCKYVAPPANTPVLSLVPSSVAGTNNAHFIFGQGGLTGSETPLINKSFRVTPTNTADFSNTGGNPGLLALTITPGTGAFTGTFTLTDGGTRKVAFNGLLIPRTDVRQGTGYFLLPGLSPSITTSPILSGLVQIVPGP